MHSAALFTLGLGFALGLKHATEADHLVAVATVVSEQRSVLRSALVGALWGVGHTASLFAAGVIVIILRVAIPARVATMLELAVALMIILLGSRILYLLSRRRTRVHAHTHTHDGVRAHTHLHFHDAREAHDATMHARAHKHGGGLSGWRPLAVGAVHGLAGSAALTLLVLTEVVRDGSRTLGLAYLVVFGVGSVGGMLLMSMIISTPFVFTAARFQRFDAPLRLFAGLASVAFGLYYAWHTTASW
jgi:ABC-type nickel/cobalt efflux system permease component RcnA